MEASIDAMDQFLAPLSSQGAIIDAHCHLQLLQDRDGLIDHLVHHHVDVCSVCATCPEDWDEVERLHEDNPNRIVPSFGIHPWFLRGHMQKVTGGAETEIATLQAYDAVASASGDWMNRLRRLLDRYPCAGVGECGLDKGAKTKTPLDVQLRCLEDHLAVAGDLGRFTFCRRQPDRLPSALILHACNSLPPEMVSAFMQLPNIYFSLSATVLSSPKQLLLVPVLPRDRLLLESDSPDQLPRSVRAAHPQASTNTPAIVRYLAHGLAELLGTCPEELLCTVRSNAAVALCVARVAP